MIGTLASVTSGVAWGVHVVRVHDVLEAALTARMADSIYRFPQ